MEDRPGRESDKFNLRLPDGMRDRLREEAEQNGRSMNAEIVARLIDSFEKAQAVSDLAVTMKDSIAKLDAIRAAYSGYLAIFMRRATDAERAELLAALGEPDPQLTPDRRNTG